MLRRTGVITAAIIAAAGGWLLTSQTANPGVSPITGKPADLRPGSWFPPGFPLHGTVKLLTSPVVEMGSRNRHQVEITIGDMAIEHGMTIEVWKHFTSDMEEFQIDSATRAAYFSAAASAAGVTLEPAVHTNWVQRNTPSVFPYRKTAGITVKQGRLKQGDKVLFDLGGTRGVRMQFYEEALFNFRFVILNSGKVLGYIGDANLRVTGGQMRRLRVQAPSVVKAGEAFPLEVVPTDEWSSQAKNPAGLKLKVRSADIQGGNFAWDQALQHYIARDVVAIAPGTLRIEVGTEDGQYRATSNPVWVESDPVRRTYFGELHQHTYLADGRGNFEDLYLYGRRVGLLDFGAVTPHHNGLTGQGPDFYVAKRYPVDAWPALQATTRMVNGWQGFVSLLGYEYSVGTAIGGHHNIFYNADSARSTMELDPMNPNAPIAKMLQTVQLARVPTLVIPHIGGGPPDWSHATDSRVERLFEVASVHGVFEESWQKHLAAGLRQGAIAAGDTHTTMMGAAYPGLIYVSPNGLAGVQALTKDRSSIWDALYSRRTFAATGNQRMLVDFQVNGEPMGGEISSQQSKEARIQARVSGTSPLLRVDLIRNNEVVHSIWPARASTRAKLLRIVWGDNIYQRRAATGFRSGSLTPSGGRLRMRAPVNLDQGFEEVRQQANGIVWSTAAVSNDRDGVLVDTAEVSGGSIHFRLDDAGTVGVIEADIPLAVLEANGHWEFKREASNVQHPYMKAMGVAPAFFIYADLVDINGPMDSSFEFIDRKPIQPGDYFYLRLEQLDTNKAWSSPVWVN
ncbi:MAG TPA: DUF3604 domain-containing protein [Bryobacteraceae bacterium]|nr:DUF3604 domain-containing protein [Bryobacteraceae bacterium]